MSDDRQHERLLLLARQYLAQGATPNAIDVLRRLLSGDPDHAEAHALLAICLINGKRLHAAEVEAGLALTADAELPAAHLAMGWLQVARRRFAEAEARFLHAAELEPGAIEPQRALAKVYELTGRRALARQTLTALRAQMPDDAEVLVALGEIDLAEGRGADAGLLARAVLAADAEHQDALVLLGHVALRDGDLTAARDLCRAALHVDPSDAGALNLLAEVKARGSWTLGLWWRFQTKMRELGETGTIVVLLGGFVAYRLLTLMLADAGQPNAANAVQLAWLGLCIYTWVAPGLFERALQRELEPVTLSEKF